MNGLAKNSTGFSLIEILVSLGLLALLAGATMVAVNPTRQFALARNTQRKTDLASILSAITQNAVELQGKFTCEAQIPANFQTIKQDGLNLRPCLVPNYLAEIPQDPSTGQKFTNGFYNTDYEIQTLPDSGRIWLKAPKAELGEIIELVK